MSLSICLVVGTVISSLCYQLGLMYWLTYILLLCITFKGDERETGELFKVTGSKWQNQRWNQGPCFHSCLYELFWFTSGNGIAIAKKCRIYPLSWKETIRLSRGLYHNQYSHVSHLTHIVHEENCIPCKRSSCRIRCAGSKLPCPHHCLPPLVFTVAN